VHWNLADAGDPSLRPTLYHVSSRKVNARPLLEQLEETMASTERLHALLQYTLAKRDRVAAHLYQSQREYRQGIRDGG
jgi:hypothetical protein